MKRLWVLTFLAFLALPGLCLGDLSVTGDLKVPAYKMVRLKAEGAAADSAIVWDVSPEEQADVWDSGPRLVFVAPPGKYSVKCRSIKGSAVETVRVSVVIGNSPPPVPPAPPGPVPPTPDDPFALAVRAAYISEVDPQKATLRGALAVLYRSAASDSYLSAAPTYGALFDKMSADAARLGVSGKLPLVQAAVQGELKRALPVTRPQALDKVLASNEFLKVAGALDLAARGGR